MTCGYCQVVVESGFMLAAMNARFGLLPMLEAPAAVAEATPEVIAMILTGYSIGSLGWQAEPGYRAPLQPVLSPWS